jgi:glycosyltransferase involved in cell wall biosynthesis
MTPPLVTVTICTYNGARYLSDTLDSVLAQTYQNMEVVVIDDGSRDDTVSIIKRYADSDSRIRWVARENVGLPASRNFSFSQARGEWIALIDQDDLCYPERLARQIAVAAEYPSAGLIFCDTEFIDNAGRGFGNLFSGYSLPNSFIRKGLAANLLLGQGPYASSAACMLKRTTIDQVGLLKESLGFACDYEYFVRAGFEVDFAYAQDALVAWRRHAGQQTSTNFNRYREARSVLRCYFSRHGVTLSTRLLIVWRITRYFAAETYYRARKGIALFNIAGN